MPVPETDPLRITIWMPAALPGVTVADFVTDRRLLHGVKDRLATVRTLQGRGEWWANGRIWRSGPDRIQLKLPGDLHQETARDGAARFQVVVYDAALVREARERLGRPFAAPASLSIDAESPEGTPLARLHDLLARPGPRLRLQDALVRALTALVELTSAAGARVVPRGSRYVRRARELIDAKFTEDVSLDEIAAHAGLDKYHLSRAFRDAVGLSPYAYLTHRRVGRAQTLLASGMRPSEVASSVGLYDQSQLNRHFKRIVGVTPGAYTP